MTTIALDVTHYSYRVIWSAEDEEFLATCIESPSLSWLAETQVTLSVASAHWYSRSSMTCVLRPKDDVDRRPSSPCVVCWDQAAVGVGGACARSHCWCCSRVCSLRRWMRDSVSASSSPARWRWLIRGRWSGSMWGGAIQAVRPG